MTSPLIAGRGKASSSPEGLHLGSIHHLHQPPDHGHPGGSTDRPRRTHLHHPPSPLSAPHPVRSPTSPQSLSSSILHPPPLFPPLYVSLLPCQPNGWPRWEADVRGGSRATETSFGASRARMAVLMDILIIVQDGLLRNKDGSMSTPPSLW